jgi:hypothetical protein
VAPPARSVEAIARKQLSVASVAAMGRSAQRFEGSTFGVAIYGETLPNIGPSRARQPWQQPRRAAHGDGGQKQQAPVIEKIKHCAPCKGNHCGVELMGGRTIGNAQCDRLDAGHLGGLPLHIPPGHSDGAWKSSLRIEAEVSQLIGRRLLAKGQQSWRVAVE